MKGHYDKADMPGHSYKKGRGMGQRKNEGDYGNCRMEEEAVRGQTIRTESSPDKSSYPNDKREALMGRKMGGGPTDVSHSLTGAGQVETYNDDKPSRTDY